MPFLDFHIDWDRPKNYTLKKLAVTPSTVSVYDGLHMKLSKPLLCNM